MSTRGHALFDTAIGRCGIAWGPDGLTALQLPEPTDEETAARLLRRGGPERGRHAELAVGGGGVPAAVQAVIDAVAALLRGEPRHLRDVTLDMAGVPPFHQRVYVVTRAIGPGETRSYGEIAMALGTPGGARAVGQALGRNPFPIVVPCHRVLAARGKSGGFSASGGVTTKLRMLAIERERLTAGRPDR